MIGEIFTINARRADGKIYRNWQAELVEETADYWLFVGKFSATIEHQQIGIIEQGTISYEYFWKNRWYSIFRFHHPSGELRNFYCNVNQPPSFSKNVLDYIDLDLDVLVWKDLSYQVLDLDEFQTNSVAMNYSADLKKNVQKGLDEIIHLIKNRLFPFDFWDK